MLIETIMGWLKDFVLFLISLLPEIPDLSDLKPFVDALFQCYTNLDSFISVRACCICLVALILIYNVQFIWSIIMWVVRKIPGVS